MSTQLPWIERTWSFNFPVGLYPDILARLRGTPARIEEAIGGMSPDILTHRERAGTWSILENVGHLLDLESLFAGRLEDFIAGQATLRAADMTNRASHEANHNNTDTRKLTAAFRSARRQLMTRLDALSDTDFAKQAMHPRLNMPMRVVDMCQFQADHDDYHLARIHQLCTVFQVASHE